MPREKKELDERDLTILIELSKPIPRSLRQIGKQLLNVSHVTVLQRKDWLVEHGYVEKLNVRGGIFVTTDKGKAYVNAHKPVTRTERLPIGAVGEDQSGTAEPALDSQRTGSPEDQL